MCRQSIYGSEARFIRILNASLMLDDPTPRQSHHSYFVQLADLVAYAAFRAVVWPGKSVGQVVPPTLWNELGPAIHLPVNSISGGVPGIVRRPR